MFFSWSTCQDLATTEKGLLYPGANNGLEQHGTKAEHKKEWNVAQFSALILFTNAPFTFSSEHLPLPSPWPSFPWSQPAGHWHEQYACCGTHWSSSRRLWPSWPWWAGVLAGLARWLPGAVQHWSTLPPVVKTRLSECVASFLLAVYCQKVLQLNIGKGTTRHVIGRTALGPLERVTLPKDIHIYSHSTAVMLATEEMRTPYASGWEIWVHKFRNAYERKEIIPRETSNRLQKHLYHR